MAQKPLYTQSQFYEKPKKPKGGRSVLPKPSKVSVPKMKEPKAIKTVKSGPPRKMKSYF
jgi:hypothetical protein